MTGKLKKFPDHNETGGVIINEEEFLATGIHVIMRWKVCSYSDAVNILSIDQTL